MSERGPRSMISNIKLALLGISIFEQKSNALLLWVNDLRMFYDARNMITDKKRELRNK